MSFLSRRPIDFKQKLYDLSVFRANLIYEAIHFFILKVSAFSTWEKELHKIVFDPRYLLLNPKERKQVK